MEEETRSVVLVSQRVLRESNRGATDKLTRG